MVLPLGKEAVGWRGHIIWDGGERELVCGGHEETWLTELTPLGTLFFQTSHALRNLVALATRPGWKGWSRCLPVSQRETRHRFWYVPGTAQSLTLKCHRRQPRTTLEPTAAQPPTSWALSAKTFQSLLKVTVAPLWPGPGWRSLRGDKKELSGLGRGRLTHKPGGLG